MGAKQSKRSVDISGKEAENAGEVAAAGAGGEGRVEPIADADADALKPQLNGAAHIQPPQDISDKEKQLDSGTPENEKDATTEKEGKEEQNEEKETTPVTNGDSEPKEENGDSVPTPEDGKKPKKEKVKKKWSLRSISFSRKDKPKQEKKSKEEEPKTNGEPEKVPEESQDGTVPNNIITVPNNMADDKAAEATPESSENKIADVVQTNAEVKEEKTPETPVTEPMTNGSSTPESAKADALADEPAPAPETKPEQLPINGLSLEEPKREVPVEAPAAETKPEEPATDATETAPAPEIPVKTEVCDAKLPLIEPTPPPLPANPPPSSVASFAATTMAPELVEASLANTTENAILTPPTIPDAAANRPDESNFDTQTVITNLAVTQISPPLKEIASEDPPTTVTTSEEKEEDAIAEQEIVNVIPEIPNNDSEIEVAKHEPKAEPIKVENEPLSNKHIDESIKIPVEAAEVTNIPKSEPEPENKIVDPPIPVELEVNKEPSPVLNGNGDESGETPSEKAIEVPPVDSCTDIENQSPEPISDIPNSIEELPPPPPPEEDCTEKSDEITPISGTEAILTENITNDNLNGDTAVITDEAEQKNLKNKKVDALGNIVDKIECNGNGVSSPSGAECATPEPPVAENADADAELPPPPELSSASPSPSPPPQPQPDALQELPIADKIADLIPEIPTIPELKTETESAVAVAD